MPRFLSRPYQITPHSWATSSAEGFRVCKCHTSRDGVEYICSRQAEARGGSGIKILLSIGYRGGLQAKGVINAFEEKV